MNIYIRYFDAEALVKTADEAADFLRTMPDINVDDFLVKELSDYINCDMLYPKRFKVSNRSYFIVIKTTANTMQEFKEAGNVARDAAAEKAAEKAAAEQQRERFAEVKPGWYEARMQFKRVVVLPTNQKSQYVDATIAVKMKAESIQDSYNLLVQHLTQRPDVDKRSQFPSIKSRNFECTFLGND